MNQRKWIVITAMFFSVTLVIFFAVTLVTRANLTPPRSSAVTICTEEYPIAIWNNGGGVDEYVTKVRSDSGANIVLTDATVTNPTESIRRLNLAVANRVQLIMNLESFVSNNDFPNNANTQTDFTNWVNAVKNHRGLYGYLYSDEPDLHDVATPKLLTNFKPIIDKLRILDTTHPSMVHVFSLIQNNGAKTKEYLEYADMTGFDYYPIAHPSDRTDGGYYRNFGELNTMFDQFLTLSAQKTYHHTKSYYYIFQAMGPQNRAGSDTYWPTYDELYSQLTAMKNKSSKFQMIWQYFYYFGDHPYYTEVPMKLNTEFMQRVKQMSNEVQNLYATGQLLTNYPVKIDCRESNVSTQSTARTNTVLTNSSNTNSLTRSTTSSVSPTTSSVCGNAICETGEGCEWNVTNQRIEKCTNLATRAEGGPLLTGESCSNCKLLSAGTRTTTTSSLQNLTSADTVNSNIVLTYSQGTKVVLNSYQCNQKVYRGVACDSSNYTGSVLLRAWLVNKTTGARRFVNTAWANWNTNSGLSVTYCNSKPNKGFEIAIPSTMTFDPVAEELQIVAWDVKTDGTTNYDAYQFPTKTVKCN